MSIFLRSRVNWTDGPTEIKCDGRRIASFPNCFQKKGLTGEVAKAHVFHNHIGNDSRDGRTRSCTKNLLKVIAVICKLRGFGAKRKQKNNVPHRQRKSLS